MAFDKAFALALGKNEFAWMCLFAVRSIRRHNPEAEIYTFLPKEEREKVEDRVLEEIRRKTQFTLGNLPMQNYEISSKIRALEVACQNSSARYKILVDADVALVERFEFEEEAELMAKPEDLTQYYTSRKSKEEWEELAELVGLPVPPFDMRNDVDSILSHRYYNAGVVVTKDEGFASEWLELTKKIHKHASRPFQADQIALALLSSKYEFRELPQKLNFPVPHYLKARKDAKLIHYHDYTSIPKIHSSEILEELEKIGLMDRYSDKRDLKMIIESIEEFLKVPKRRAELIPQRISSKLS